MQNWMDVAISCIDVSKRVVSGWKSKVINVAFITNIDDWNKVFEVCYLPFFKIRYSHLLCQVTAKKNVGGEPFTLSGKLQKVGQALGNFLAMKNMAKY